MTKPCEATNQMLLLNAVTRTCSIGKLFRLGHQKNSTHKLTDTVILVQDRRLSKRRRLVGLDLWNAQRKSS